ncbi:MAG: PfkB family carbohydrate kinase, partial [Acidimicrobiales bacterium]|nr:PfkB family carbohydrate kinase [Acidimicrobiales bacterium]
RLGGGLPVAEATRAVLGASRSDVVIAKLGAVGALVLTADRQERVGPVPTDTVWPIGSGDAFSAGFAWAWAAKGADPVEAAEVGSATAAAWCSTRTMPVAVEAMAAKPPPAPKPVRVYLAGPFFDVAQRWLVELSATALRQLGAEVFSPFHEVGVGVPDAAAQDLDGLRSGDVVLALLDGADPGTVFEVGWASRARIPVISYCERCSEEDLTMIAGSGAQVFSDLSSAVYAAAWAGRGE